MKGALVNDSPAQQAARARARRRKRMQQRQTVIFGSIIAILLGAALFGGAVWSGLVPSPINIEFKSPEDDRPPPPDQPCPPEGSMPVAFEDLSVNILNSTQTAGLGARSADDVREHGIKVESVGNAGELYLGSAKIVTGFDTLAEAYTVADLVADSVIYIDERTEDVIDIVLGSSFTDIRKTDELQLVQGEPIPAPEGCIVVAGTGTTPVEGDEPPAEEAPEEEAPEEGDE